MPRKRMDKQQKTGRGADGKRKTRAGDRRLVKSHEEYRTILESIQDGYCETDLTGKFTFFNSYMTDILGYSKNELLGMSGREVLDEDSAENVYRSFSKVYRTGEPSHRFDYKVIRKDGTHRQIEVSASLIRSEDGQPIGFRSIVRDITARKKTEEELRKTRDELEQRVMERTAELAHINQELEVKTINLEEANVALRILLRKKDENKAELEQKMMFNVKELVLPVLEKLKVSGLDERQKAYAEILEKNVQDIISPFVQTLSFSYYGLTPMEIQVANLVKQGRSTKESASLLNLSSKTVETHRRNIRRKIGIRKKKTNLRSYLQSLR